MASLKFRVNLSFANSRPTIDFSMKSNKTTLLNLNWAFSHAKSHSVAFARMESELKEVDLAL